MILKNHIFKTIICVASCIAFSCTGKFDELNGDRYGITDEERERDNYKIGSSIIGMQSFVLPTKIHLHQFQEVLAGCAFAGYLSQTPEWTAKFSTYNPPVDWSRAPFNDVITGIYPYYENLLYAEEEVVYALAKLLRVTAMHRVLDMYGPIPYSKMDSSSSEGGEIDDDGDIQGGTLTAPYDSMEDVYLQMFEELDEARQLLMDNYTFDQQIYYNYDRVYYGDVQKWVKFINSLKLRMAMRLRFVRPALAREMAEDAVSHPGGLIATNDDNAQFYPSLNNPVYEQVHVWGDDRASADIIDFMNGYQDDRRSKYFTYAITEAGTSTGAYHGLRNGTDISDKENATRYSSIVVSSSDPMVWMNAAEVSFLKAEGALAGWSMGGTARELYEDGIRLSFEQHGASGVDAYITSSNTPNPHTDFQGITAWNHAQTTTVTVAWADATSDEERLEKIITQKWIAIFPLGIEAWSEFRRTGYPKLFPVVDNHSGGTVSTDKMIRRVPYPDTEYNENRENLYDAIRMLGGPDNGGTNLWWDVNR
ncbi:MAG: SusD/RagB family nutrient-binding outer membrane lipoprotein [Alistipes sp.]|nr:SusD/RagB family nutrient-binding outer membrane lipoprotein [Alistipes sp.]